MANVVPVDTSAGLIDAMEVAARVPTANATQEWEDGYACAVGQFVDVLRDAIAAACNNEPSEAVPPSKEHAHD